MIVIPQLRVTTTRGPTASPAVAPSLHGDPTGQQFPGFDCARQIGNETYLAAPEGGDGLVVIRLSPPSVRIDRLHQKQYWANLGRARLLNLDGMPGFNREGT